MNNNEKLGKIIRHYYNKMIGEHNSPILCYKKYKIDVLQELNSINELGLTDEEIGEFAYNNLNFYDDWAIFSSESNPEGTFEIPSLKLTIVSSDYNMINFLITQCIPLYHYIGDKKEMFTLSMRNRSISCCNLAVDKDCYEKYLDKWQTIEEIIKENKKLVIEWNRTQKEIAVRTKMQKLQDDF